MDKKLMFMLPIALLVLFGFLAGSAEAVVTACGSNATIFRVQPNATIVSGTLVFNWSVVFGSDSTIMNVTNVTIFRNDTRQILCQNTSLLINTTTRGNCTMDSTTLVDDDNLPFVVEVYFANSTVNNPGRCTNVTGITGYSINNTAPSISGYAPSGKLFTGISGVATDNFTITVDNATRNCTLRIGTSGSGSTQILDTVITKGPGAANCTYQPTTAIPDGSYDIRWLAFDGLDTRTYDTFYNIQLKSDHSSSVPTLNVAVAKEAAQQSYTNNMRTVFILIVLLALAVWYMGKK